MKIDNARPGISATAEDTPLLPPNRGDSARQSVVDVSLRTSRSNMWQRLDSSLSGLPTKARVERTAVPGVYVDHAGSDAFKQSTHGALRRLASLPTGNTLLKQVSSMHAMHPEKRVVILPTDKETVTAATWHAPKNVLPGFNHLETAVARPTQDGFMPWVAGPGVDTAVIRYNHQVGRDYASDPHKGKVDPALAFVDLGHEMIHANRLLHGGQYDVPIGDSLTDSNNPAAEEELRTTGAGPWRNEPISENTMRRELGLAERGSYGGNPGTRLRPPPEQNSPHTDGRLRELQAETRYKQS